MEGFVNVDVPGPQTFLAQDRRDLVDKWITRESDYYGKHASVSIQSLRRGPLNQVTVCDRYGSFEFLPFKNETVSHALIRQAFEHLSITEARRALNELHRCMLYSGLITIDVPDHVATLQLFRESGDEFFVRHLLGPRRGDDFGHHVMSYEPRQLKALVESHGFVFVSDNPNIHLYPSICQTFRRT